MFSKLEYLSFLKTTSLDEALSRINTVKFEQDDFTSRESEQFMVISWSQKKQFIRPAGLWLAHLCAEGAVEEYIESCIGQQLFRISTDENLVMNKINGYLSELKKTFTIPITGKFIQAMMMVEDWNEFSVIVEMENGFFAFSWETSA